MNYLEKLSREIHRISEEFEAGVEFLAAELLSTFERGCRVYTLGNGGSASTAQHFAIDILSIGKVDKVCQIFVQDLTSNTSILTAIGNDLAFTEIFAAQLERFGAQGDLVVLFSASGNSLNLLELVNVCQQKGMRTFGLIGFSGDQISKHLTATFHCQMEKKEYGIAEDIHLSFSHAVTERFREKLQKRT